jgi:phosphoglucosamine mutase
VRFGTDGVRGVAYTELTTDLATRIARAAARVLAVDAGRDAPHEVVIGGDTRASTPDFEMALAAGFRHEGVDVVTLGVVPTPFVAFEAQRRGALGAMVSASHNPATDNGIKLFARGGTKLGDEVQRRIEALLDTPGVAVPADGDTAGADAGDHPAQRSGAELTPPTHAAYVEHVLGLLEGRRLDGVRVVLDCANGAGHEVAPEVLRAAGADVVVIADRPDGRNINAGCGATEPTAVAGAVIEHGADVGIALDGDADRLIAVDHAGRVVDGDHVIAMCALDLRARGRLRHDTVVVTVMSNLGLRLAMREADIHVVETPVGDRYVLEALARGGYSLGGEQSGHVIFADHATTGDGVLTAVALLDAVRRSGCRLAELADRTMTALPQVLVNVRVAERAPDVAERIADRIAAAEAQLGETGRVLVRASGTEPLVRVMVEAPSAELAEDIAGQLVVAVQDRLS